MRQLKMFLLKSPVLNRFEGFVGPGEEPSFES